MSLSGADFAISIGIFISHSIVSLSGADFAISIGIFISHSIVSPEWSRS